MKNKPIDYRKFRLNKLGDDEFKHLKFSFFWPVYGFMFLFVERLYHPAKWYLVHCKLDDMIPFNEFFAIPYILWFVFLIGTFIYMVFMDVETFTKMMWFSIMTYSAAIIIFLIYPNYQDLRPTEFERNNILTYIMSKYYIMDTNTNVCPSIHVVGSFEFAAAAWHSKCFKGKTAFKIFMTVMAALISVSVLFVKQHSAVDLFVAIPMSVIAYLISFKPWKKSEKTDREKELTYKA